MLHNCNITILHPQVIKIYQYYNIAIEQYLNISILQYCNMTIFYYNIEKLHNVNNIHTLSTLVVRLFISTVLHT